MYKRQQEGLAAALAGQQAEHERLMAQTKAAHAAVVEGHKQHLAAAEMAALEQREAHEKALLTANEEWRRKLETEQAALRAQQAGLQEEHAARLLGAH